MKVIRIRATAEVSPSVPNSNTPDAPASENVMFAPVPDAPENRGVFKGTDQQPIGPLKIDHPESLGQIKTGQEVIIEISAVAKGRK